MTPFKPVRPTIRELQIGDSVEFPIEQQGSVRTAAYELGKRLRRKFVTATVDDDTYRVTRTA
ncbi:MAG: hypothetical protein K2G93_08230 [Rikenella sp.]|nr:hypothetical protein [Rikenella sp.]